DGLQLICISLGSHARRDRSNEHSWVGPSHHASSFGGPRWLVVAGLFPTPPHRCAPLCATLACGATLWFGVVYRGPLARTCPDLDLFRRADPTGCRDGWARWLHCDRHMASPGGPPTLPRPGAQC